MIVIICMFEIFDYGATKTHLLRSSIELKDIKLICLCNGYRWQECVGGPVMVELEKGNQRFLRKWIPPDFLQHW